MKFLPIILCLLWLEIDNPRWNYSARVRVMDSEFLSDLYVVERSTDGGRSWKDYKFVVNGEWTDVNSTLTQSLFRARRR